MPHDPDTNANFESLLRMVSDLHERTRQLEELASDAGWTLDPARSELPTPSEEEIDAATTLVRRAGTASVSLLQRELRLSYLSAFALLDVLEERGVIGPFRGESERVVNQPPQYE